MMKNRLQINIMKNKMIFNKMINNNKIKINKIKQINKNLVTKIIN